MTVIIILINIKKTRGVLLKKRGVFYAPNFTRGLRFSSKVATLVN